MLAIQTQTAKADPIQNLMKNEPAKAQGTEAENVTITSRFGEVTVSLKNSIAFPHGLLGLPQFKHYALSTMPNPKLGSFKLLQSLEDADLSFAVLPVASDTPLIEKADILECCNAVGVEEKDLALMLIVSVQKLPGGNSRITANLRAPVMVDTNRKLAMQYVFPHTKYQIAYELN